MKFTKRILSIVISLVIVFSVTCIGFQAYSADPNQIDSKSYSKIISQINQKLPEPQIIISTDKESYKYKDSALVCIQVLSEIPMENVSLSVSVDDNLVCNDQIPDCINTELLSNDALTYKFSVSLSHKAKNISFLQKVILFFKHLFKKNFSSVLINIYDGRKDVTKSRMIPFETSFGTITAKVWYNDKVSNTDLDSDGVIDYVEKVNNMNVSLPDTDGDGLTDYEEFYIVGTDPTKIDSDNNGISDYNDDLDCDGLSNSYELQVGTDPMVKDSDGDSLTDKEELLEYNTDPLNPDTDSDGASDGWEINHGFDPLSFNHSFNVIESLGEPTDNNPVSPSVQINLKGTSVESLSISPVGIMDNPLLSENIPGYLASAYEFNTDEEFEEATISFDYDVSLGKLSPTFQPRIYYFNEEEGTFEELPNQSVTDGKISASVTHFSKYILLNKADYDEVWNTEIKYSETSSAKTRTDIVFVVDSSGSMNNNDPQRIRIDVVKSFIENLGENDQAAIIDFDSKAIILQSFTSNHDSLYQAVDMVDSSGGTSLSAGISSAISLFTDSSYNNPDTYKCIVFLTDGDGSYSTSYTTLAAENEIVVYTVGLGSGVKRSKLEAISNGTNGKYFSASQASDLYDIYGVILDETIDYITDSNNDGISDYFTKLIYEGELVLSNGSDEFMGIDFNYDANGNPSDDFDGDGLKNGEELIVTIKNKRVYMKMYSDPMMVYSDSDEYNDMQEKERGTNPLVVEYFKSGINALCFDEYYYAATSISETNNIGYLTAEGTVATVTGVWNVQEIYRDEILNYFYDYPGLQQMEVQEAIKTTAENLTSVVKLGKDTLSNIKKGLKYLSKAGSDYLPTINRVARLKTEAKALTSYLYSSSRCKSVDLVFTNAVTNRLYDVLKESKEISSSGKYNISLKIKGVSDKYNAWMNKPIGNSKIKNGTVISLGMDVVSGAIDIANTVTNISKINANMTAYKQNMDILIQMKNAGGNGNARNAANSVLSMIGENFGSYSEELTKAIVNDSAELVLRTGLTLLSSQCTFIKAIQTAVSSVDFVLGDREKIVEHMQMCCDYAMVRTAISLFYQNAHFTTDYWLANNNDGDVIRILIHIAQLRALGELNYGKWNSWHGAVGWFADNSEIRNNCKNKILNMKANLDLLGLTPYVYDNIVNIANKTDQI